MIVYNISIKIPWEIEKEWQQWAKEIDIPWIMATDLFHDVKIYRLLDNDEAEGPTFIIQCFTLSLKSYKIFVENFAADHELRVLEKWGNQLVSFRTAMQLVQ